MIKFFPDYTSVVFEEVPDEITLAINITNCQNRCVGCHSPELREDIGEELTFDVLEDLIDLNDGITCICLMGEGNDEKSLKNIITYIKEKHKGIKIALYSGRVDIKDDFYCDNLDYLKIGPYIEKFGALNKETTNQRMYKICRDVSSNNFIDITNRFYTKRE